MGSSLAAQEAPMKHLPWLLLAAVLAYALLAQGTVGSVGPVVERGHGEQELLWLADVDAGFEAARSTGKPLLILFRCVP